MKILLIGSGAVGLGIASCLLKSKVEVDFFTRRTTGILLRDKGFYRKGIFGNEYHLPDSFKVFDDFEKISETYDFIAICTKTNISKKIAEQLNKYRNNLGNNFKIILFQNGWGMNDPFECFFKKENIFNGVVITGFTRPEKNIVNITVHSNDIHIGNLFNHSKQDVENLAQKINSGGLPAKATSDIEKYMWAKMLYNTTLNPLGAIFKVDYGKLANSDYTKDIMKKIINEIFCVMESENYTTFWKSSEEYEEDFFNKILPPTGKHRSSMLQDIESGRKTEIDTLTGVIIRLGNKNNIQVGTNKIIYNMIKFIEKEV